MELNNEQIDISKVAIAGQIQHLLDCKERNTLKAVGEWIHRQHSIPGDTQCKCWACNLANSLLKGEMPSA